MNQAGTLLLTALILLAPGALASAQALDGQTDPDPPSGAQVIWADPDGMSEARVYNPRPEEPRTWLAPLAQHLEQAVSKHLAPGQQMDILIVDVLRAGRFEPWHMASGLERVRIYRNTTPPRLILDYQLLDADGRVLAEGRERLVDGAYQRRGFPGTHDPLRYEKRMIDNWANRMFKKTGKRR